MCVILHEHCLKHRNSTLLSTWNVLVAKKDCQATNPSNSKFSGFFLAQTFSFPTSKARRIGCDWMLRLGCGCGVGTLLGMGR